MSLFHTLGLAIYDIFAEALFPPSKAERELFGMSPEQALYTLPPSPEVPFANMHAVFAYKDERVKELVWNIKYKKKSQAVAIGSHALYQSILNSFGEDGINDRESVSASDNKRIIIIPMPISKRRSKERGFNQCEILADKIKNLDIGNKVIIEKNLLLRPQHTNRQTLKDRQERLKSAKGIFSVNKDITITGNPPLIVIDDVITTGSTMNEAVNALKASGFDNVRGLSLAH